MRRGIANDIIIFNGGRESFFKWSRAAPKGNLQGGCFLTEMQKKFCREFLVDANANAAAVRAGYSAKMHGAGARLMKNAEIRERIREEMGEMDRESGGRAEEVVAFLTAVMRGEVEELRSSAKDRMHAAELLGKRYGVFEDKERGGERVTVIISGEEQLK